MRSILLGWMALSTYLQANSNSKSFVSLLPLARLDTKIYKGIRHYSSASSASVNPALRLASKLKGLRKVGALYR